MITRTVFRPTQYPSQLSLCPRTCSFREINFSRFPLTSFPRKPAKMFCLTETHSPSCDDRKFTKLPPSEWTNYFHFVSVDVSEMDAIEREIEALKPKVREIFISPKEVDLVKKRILMIYLLVSLGLAYHFEDEIEETLKDGFEKIEEMMAGENDLYTVSTIFWVFRTYGYNMSSEVFTRFKVDNGKFMECLIEDVRGMLSLYEAANLGTTKDFIMDEALSFTSKNLASFADDVKCPSHLSRHIRNALGLSQHWNMQILVTVEYIRFYEKEDDHDGLLLKFSKLNFNLLQRHYLQEVKILTKWYKDYDFASKLPRYYRELIVEMHFFSIAMFFEPQFSRARIMQTKLFIAELLCDDTCDRYAFFPEIESLVNSLERWFPDEDMGTHPDFLKFVFNFIVDTFDDCERELRPEGRSYSVKETKEILKIFARASLDLAKFAIMGHVPSFEEYMEIGKLEIGTDIALAGTLIGLDQIDEKEAFDWLKSRCKLLESFAVKARLLNDLVGFEEDMRRGNVYNGLNCYMKQHGVSEEEGFRCFQKMIAVTRKEMNEDFLKTTDVPRRILKTVFDGARCVSVAYNVGEGVTHLEGKITKHIISLYVDKISF